MSADRGRIRIVADAAELTRVAAEEVLARVGDAVRLRGLATVCLAGGGTPRALYALLASAGDPSFRARMPWDRVHFFWGDERHVAPDHRNSNYGMARTAMLTRVPVDRARVHRIQAEHPDADVAARNYQAQLLDFFGARGLLRGGVPRFDVVLLGMGADGHTASLFPGTDAVRETTRVAVAVWVPAVSAHRITLTSRDFNRAAFVMFHVSGPEKAETLRAVIEGPEQPDVYPCQTIRPVDGELLWLVDQHAARLLTPAAPVAGQG
jgi:6-phosphogluconolactonase